MIRWFEEGGGLLPQTIPPPFHDGTVKGWATRRGSWAGAYPTHRDKTAMNGAPGGGAGWVCAISCQFSIVSCEL